MLLQALQPVQIIERHRSNPLIHAKFKSKAPYKKINNLVSKENRRLLLFETSSMSRVSLTFHLMNMHYYVGCMINTIENYFVMMNDLRTFNL
jgi:hypothetical protein